MLAPVESDHAVGATNSVSGMVHGPVVQSGIHIGDVHVHPVPQPSLQVLLLAGLRYGSEGKVLPLDEGASSMRIASPVHLGKMDVDRTLVVQVINGPVQVWIEQLDVEFTGDPHPSSLYSLPRRTPGAAELPHPLPAGARASWPVDLAAFDQYVTLVTGSAPWPALPLRARVVTGADQTVHGHWHHYDAITPSPHS